ncbi:hypothetical protein GE21DRAFT_9873 [Neurospora crassa]|uniref:Uncharacterized protein n=1 Tax=Neurospora crassa (strain ATCC 24698 / 74-OR23-1A / CBS 708.71 / DSM 1257 / FGSC 987) TaxID=367110 RepID=Q7S4K9_NEUCR|nr:hypothetical protein NCU09591 [Neurospora crassa OR74A]EAA30466.1 hypothetical protein NCU09591 [Neurospora crassa OR74A]KHE81527.1 hypothetical protein GE21DRAFT_9873 [Neurospora crassa]|eukprot:XP_959702.1 hypothetical protein NCU09591 [Neurospora crassa OR74A]
MPATARFGYAVGVVGKALQDGCAEEELKDAILRYVLILIHDFSDAETTEVAQKLLHRELLCEDMLFVLMELERNGSMDILANKDTVSDENVAICQNVKTVVDNDVIVNEDSANGEFVFNHDLESDAVSETDSDASEWEIL